MHTHTHTHKSLSSHYLKPTMFDFKSRRKKRAMGTVPWFEVPLQARCKLFWNWIIGSSVWGYLLHTRCSPSALYLNLVLWGSVRTSLSPGEDSKNSPLVTDVGQIQVGVRHFRGLQWRLVHGWFSWFIQHLLSSHCEISLTPQLALHVSDTVFGPQVSWRDP